MDSRGPFNYSVILSFCKMFKFWSVTKVYNSAMIRPIKLFQISALNYRISFCGFGHYNLLFKS